MRALHGTLACRSFVLVVVPLLPPLAFADCSAVIGAYAKAQATGRFGWVDAGKLDEPTKKGPFSLVNIGNDGWFASMDTKDGGKFKKIPSGAAQARADAVRDNEKQGQSRCEPLGERKVGGDPLVGYLIRDNSKSAEDFAALHVWISKSTGLPVYHGLSENGGFRWVYGDAVAPPQPNQIAK